MANTSIFGSKDGGDRVQGTLTRDGAAAFERVRARIALYVRRLSGRDVAVSDGETIEYLARGEREAMKAIIEENRK